MNFLFKDELIRWAIRKLGRLHEHLYLMQSVPLWHSSDGSVRPISDMDDQHLRNAVCRLEREYPSDKYRQPALPYLRAEMKRRGLAKASKRRHDYRIPRGY